MRAARCSAARCAKARCPGAASANRHGNRRGRRVVRRRLVHWFGACVAALVALLGVASCELTEVTIAAADDVIVAQTNLVVELDHEGPGTTLDVFAYLQRTLNAEVARPVPGAVVSITGPSGTVRLTEREDGSECFYFPGLAPGDTLTTHYRTRLGSCYGARITPSPFAPGETLSQEIALPDGRRLAAVSQLPGAFVLRGLDQRDGRCRMEPDTNYRFAWTAAEGSWSYLSEARFEGLKDALAGREIEAPDTLHLLGISIGDQDTEVVFPRQYGFFRLLQDDFVGEIVGALQDGMPAGASAEIAIVATDRNWVNWVRGGNFNPSGEIHIPSVFGEGGTGSFGTGTGRRIRVSARPGEEGPLCGVGEG